MMEPNITPVYFLTLFTEFKNYDAATIAAFIEIASYRVPPSVWKKSAPYATALLAAHMLTTSGVQGGGPAGGPVTQEQVGDLSRSFQAMADQSSGDGPLMTTRYGIDFVAFRRERIVGAMPTVNPRRRPWWGCW